MSFDLLWRFFARAAIGGLIAAVVIAWGVSASWETRVSARSDTTARVLNLGVFGTQAEGLSHGKLVVGR